jgi:hypothetical protein
MALENGLKPSIRGYHGVGFGRVLPEPFVFVNSWQGDGVNDYFEIPELVGETYNTLHTDSASSVEFWDDHNQRGNDGLFCIEYSDGAIESYAQPAAVAYTYGITGGTLTAVSLLNQPSVTNLAKNFCCLSMGRTTFQSFNNGSKVEASGTKYAQILNPSVSIFRLAKYLGGHFPLRSKIAEFRYYIAELLTQDILQSYNGGNGANPSKPEFLLLWFDFLKAEPASELYPGGLPSGWTVSDWGIRNKAAKEGSVKKFHAKAMNMTNNSTLGGTIKPW